MTIPSRWEVQQMRKEAEDYRKNFVYDKEVVARMIQQEQEARGGGTAHPNPTLERARLELERKRLRGLGSGAEIELAQVEEQLQELTDLEERLRRTSGKTPTQEINERNARLNQEMLSKLAERDRREAERMVNDPAYARRQQEKDLFTRRLTRPAPIWRKKRKVGTEAEQEAPGAETGGGEKESEAEEAGEEEEEGKTKQQKKQKKKMMMMQQQKQENGKTADVWDIDLLVGELQEQDGRGWTTDPRHSSQETSGTEEMKELWKTEFGSSALETLQRFRTLHRFCRPNINLAALLSDASPPSSAAPAGGGMEGSVVPFRGRREDVEGRTFISVEEYHRRNEQAQ